MSNSILRTKNKKQLFDIFPLHFRIAFLSFSPFIKRFFYSSPELYQTFNAAAVVVSLDGKFNSVAAYIAAIFLLITYIRELPLDFLMMALPSVCVLVLYQQRDPRQAVSALWSLRFLFVAAVAYGASQKFIGYLPHEIEWIYSSAGMVRAEGFFVTYDVRAFSFFAGVPEFSLFAVVMAYLSWIKRAYAYLALSAFALFIAGSRGIMVSAGAASLMAFVYLRLPKTLSIISAIITPLLFYAGTVYFVSLYNIIDRLQASESRLWVTGTFNARVTLTDDFFTNLTPEKFIFGDEAANIFFFDNMFLTLNSAFGLFGLIALSCFFVWMHRWKSNIFFWTLNFSYLLYSDAIFSIYYLYIVLLANSLPSQFAPVMAREAPIEAASWGLDLTRLRGSLNGAKSP